MDKFNAEKIINAYGGAIANDKNPFKKQSMLPCSKGRIRYAFFVYLSAIISDMGTLPTDIGESLVATYCMLDAFVTDNEAERLNKIPGKIKDKQLNTQDSDDKKQIDEYFSLVPTALRNGNYFDEINEYIGECYKEKGHKV